MRPRSAPSEVIALEDAPAALDLTSWTGDLHAHSVAPDTAPGHVRAAQVDALRRIRDQRLYAGYTNTWDEFCEKYLQFNRRSVDRNIRQLREFGPVFFRLAETMRLASREYRLIRGHICPQGVRFDGAVIPFGAEHCDDVSDAVMELLRRSGSKIVKDGKQSFARVMSHIEVATRMLERYGRPLDRLQKFELAAMVGRSLRRARQLGVRAA